MALKRLKKAFLWRYRRFVQRQGYVVMTVLCAAIIAASAAWTQQGGFRRFAPTPTGDAASAADLWQQSLREAATPTPDTAAAIEVWHSPVAEAVVLQGFDAERLVASGIPGLWRVHDAVDLAVLDGEPIKAMREGILLEIIDQGLSGMCVIVDHDGYLVEYAGLTSTSHLQPGQNVSVGEVIGYAGTAHDHASVSCLHLRVTRDQQAIDPMTLLKQPQP